jgi:integrase/recombinase XerC
MDIYRRFATDRSTPMTQDLATIPAAELPAFTGPDVIRAWLEGRSPRTLEAYAKDLEDFARFLKAGDPAAAVDALLAAGQGLANRIALGYRADMQRRALAPATIARRLAAIRSMVKVARTIGRITWTVDIESPRIKPYRDTRGPGHEGFRELTAKARSNGQGPTGKRDLALMRLMYDLLLRRGECIALDLADVDLGAEKPCVHIVGKGQTESEPRTLSAAAALALREWIAARGEDPGPLFIRLDPAAPAGCLDRLTGDSVCRMVRRMSKRAALPREARPHGLRHAGITRLLDLTRGNVRDVAKASRHAKLETLMLYDDARTDVAGNLAELLGADG